MSISLYYNLMFPRLINVSQLNDNYYLCKAVKESILVMNFMEVIELKNHYIRNGITLKSDNQAILKIAEKYQL